MSLVFVDERAQYFFRGFYCICKQIEDLDPKAKAQILGGGRPTILIFMMIKGSVTEA